MAESSVQRLKEVVTCPVCTKPFKYPKLLPCLHSGCAVCLDKLKRDGVREGLKYIVSCPVCSEETELSKIGVASLPSAYFKQNMAKLCEILEVAEGKRQKMCEECGQEASASYCSSCKFICATCAEHHGRMRNFSDHSVVFLKKENVSLDELQSQLLSLKPFTTDSEMKCAKHSEQPLDKYCKPCKRLVCVTCIKENHKPPNHQTNDIHNLIDDQRGDMQQYLDTVKELRSSVNATTDGLKSTKEKLEQQQKSIEDAISNSFAELFQQLKALKLKLVDDSKKASDVQLKSLSVELELAEKKVSELNDIIQSTEESLEYTTDQELLALKRYMTVRLKELAAQKKPSPGGLDTVKVSALELSMSCAEELMKVSQNHIDRYHSLSYDKTKAVGDGTRRAEVGRESTFSVKMVTESGAPCLEKQDVLVKIVMPRTNLAVASLVTPGVEVGTYQITYLPNFKGQYQISVQISGQEIFGSPYSVSAKPSKLDLNRPYEVCISLEWPWGVACGSNRQIYVTALYQHRVIILNKEGVPLRTVGLKGQKAGCLWSPTGIAVDSDGYIYVADGQENGRVQKFNGSGQYVNSFSNLCNPHGVMLNKNEDRLYVCDKDNGQVVILDKSLQQVGALGELKPSTHCEGFEDISGTLEAPHSTAEDSMGNIYVTDSQNGEGCIHVFSSDEQHQHTITHRSNPCFFPAGICIEDDLLYVCDNAENCLVVFHTNGELVTTCGSYGTLEGQFQSPLSVAVDLDGFIYICDHGNGRVQVY